MPTYRVTHTAHLAREVERAKGVLSVHMEPGREYTAEELRELVREFGLEYSNPEYR
ncbi:MAG: hypothetical protein ACE5LU_25570 [Anaerolineae bacterium]